MMAKEPARITIPAPNKLPQELQEEVKNILDNAYTEIDRYGGADFNIFGLDIEIRCHPDPTDDGWMGISVRQTES
jgi:hypothetical protein